MKNLSVMSKIARYAMVPVLIAGLGLTVAQAQEHHEQGPAGHQEAGKDFHFSDQHKQAFQSHYQKDIDKQRAHPQNRPQFHAGDRVPASYKFQPVPSTYYRDAPPPPPGYQYGYNNGYVVAYNPTTRVIADVLDLVSAAAH